MERGQSSGRAASNAGRPPGSTMTERTPSAPDGTPNAVPGPDGAPGDGRPPLANEAGLQALGEQMAQSRPPRRRIRRRRLVIVLGVVGVLIVVAVAGVLGYAWYLNHEIHRVDVRGLSGAPTTGAERNSENILMVGSTSRCALKVQNAAYGLCSQGVTGVNSDVIMILHLNSQTHEVSILSIPRDLFIPDARADGANKIDAALYEGPDQLVKAVQEDFGIPIQHYVELNFDTFANVVDALGGINMYFPVPVYDAFSGLKVLTPGCVHLDGLHALQVVRAPPQPYKGPHDTSSDPADWTPENQSDLARIRRDHEFLRVLAAAVSKKGLSNPLTDRSIIAAVAPQLSVDSELSATDMIGLVLNFHSVDPAKTPQLTVPVAVDQSVSGYTYDGGAYGDVEFPAQPQDRQVIDRFLGITSGTDAMTGKALPRPTTVAVSVLNGTGATNQATDTADGLQAQGFKIAGIGDTTPLALQSETVVYYRSLTPASQGAAQAVARTLTGPVILSKNPAMVASGAQVTVVTGTNLAVTAAATPNAPASSAATTAPTSSSGSSSSGSSSATGTFSAPTPAAEALAPWDPRSCTPSGGEGT